MIFRTAMLKTARLIAKGTFVVLASSTAFAETSPTLITGESSIGLKVQRNFDLLPEIIDSSIPEKLHAATGPSSAVQTGSAISTPLPGEHFHYSAHWTYPCKLKKDGTFKFDGKDVRCDAAALPDGQTLDLKDRGYDEVRGPKCSCNPTPEAYCKYVEDSIAKNTPGTFVITYSPFPYIRTITVDVSSCYDQGPFRCDIIDKVPQPGGCGGPTTPPVVTTTTATTTMPKTTTAVAP